MIVVGAVAAGSSTERADRTSEAGSDEAAWRVARVGLDRRRGDDRRRDFCNRRVLRQGCAAVAWLGPALKQPAIIIGGRRIRRSSPSRLYRWILRMAIGKIDMKRKWNWPIWVGFVVAVGGLFSYEFFAQFPITRDFPWANLLLFCVGANSARPGSRSRVWAAATLSRQNFRSDLRDRRFTPFAFFAYDVFYVVRQLPGVGGRAARRPKSAGLHLARSERQTGWHLPI